MIAITVNGERRELPEGSTITDLLRQLGLDRPGIAIALDRRVVPRSAHAATVLQSGATVEVIRAVGGG
jgi:sulfur carrier protein